MLGGVLECILGLMGDQQLRGSCKQSHVGTDKLPETMPLGVGDGDFLLSRRVGIPRHITAGWACRRDACAPRLSRAFPHGVSVETAEATE